MTTESVHFKDEIQDLLDGRLDLPTRERVEAHLATCGSCRQEWEALGRIKQTIRTGLEPSEAPPTLRARVLEALQREQRRIGSQVARRLPWSIAAASLAAAALVLLLVFVHKPPDLPSAAARDYARYQAGALPLQMQTESTQAMERFFAERSIRFRTRVFDFGMMNYRLIGGRVHNLAHRPSALFVYRGEGNKILLCEMYEGNTRELPRGGQLRWHNGIRFFVYHRSGRTAVFWQEGNVTCVLTSDLAPEEAVQLAFAKAIKV